MRIPTKDIIVCTDVKTDETVVNLSSALIKGAVTDEILTFISQLSSRGLLTQWEGNTKLIELIRLHCSGVPRVLFYYTGHARGGSFLSPDQRLIHMNDVLDEVRIAMAKGEGKRELLWLSDCCQASFLDLPHLYAQVSAEINKNATRRVWTRSHDLIKERTWIQPSKEAVYAESRVTVLSISSSSIEFSALTCVHGSLFTQRFLESAERKYGLESMHMHISGGTQVGVPSVRVMFASSDPTLLEVFPWVSSSTLRIHPLGGFFFC